MFSVATILDRATPRLGLDQVTLGGSDDPAEDAPLRLVARLDVMRPPAIQVIGTAEQRHIDRHPDTLAQLVAARPAAVIVAAGVDLAPELRDCAVEHGFALLTATAGADEVVAEIAGLTAPGGDLTLHGVFIEVLGVGVLLTGDPGIGKSELALELISRGHRLIADDVPQFRRVGEDAIAGHCPAQLENFMEVRGIGIIDVRSLFGDSAVKRRRYLQLVIRLQAESAREPTPEERLYGVRRELDVLGVAIPEVTLPVAPGRNIAVLVECTVRSHLLRVKGYEAARELERRQAQTLEAAGGTESDG